MINLKVSLVVILALFPAMANAAAAWSNKAKIERIYTRSDGSVYIDFYGTQSNKSFCDKTGFYFLDKNTAGFDRLYSLLLAAKYNESDASVHLAGCAAGYPKIHHVIGY